jgi:hypothetical protein
LHAAAARVTLALAWLQIQGAVCFRFDLPALRAADARVTLALAWLRIQIAVCF